MLKSFGLKNDACAVTIETNRYGIGWNVDGGPWYEYEALMSRNQKSLTISEVLGDLDDLVANIRAAQKFIRSQRSK